MIAVIRGASAQAISIGIKGGIPLVDATGNHDESQPYIVGPSIEFRLPAGFAIEADALYRRIGNTANYAPLQGVNLFGSTITSFVNRQRGNSWEFPLLGKYYLRRRASAWQPFFGTGYAFRTVSFHSAGNETSVDAGGVSHNIPFKSNYRSSLGVGAVFAGGFRFHTGRLSVSPEFRYTRWGSSDTLLRKNEAGLLLGISF